MAEVYLGFVLGLLRVRSIPRPLSESFPLCALLINTIYFKPSYIYLKQSLLSKLNLTKQINFIKYLKIKYNLHLITASRESFRFVVYPGDISVSC